MRPLVFCPNGHVFESRAFLFGGNVRNLSLRGNRETCPACGAMAEIMDGEFDVIDGSVRILSAPQITLDRLMHLRTVFGLLRDENASPARITATLAQEAPELIAALPEDTRQWLPYLAVLISIIAIVVAIQYGQVAHHDAEVAHHDATHQVEPPTETELNEILKALLAQRGTTNTPAPTPQRPPTTQTSLPATPRPPSPPQRTPKE